MEQVKVKIMLCKENAIMPQYANEGDAGMDIFSCEEVTINPGETKLISTGIKLAIPNGYEIQIRPRSGLSLKTPLRIPNSPGTIDSGYRDEVKIIVTNTSIIEEDCPEIYTIDSKNKNGIYQILPGDKIAQMVLNKVPKIIWEPVDNVNDIGVDRKGGFGSTGHKYK